MRKQIILFSLIMISSLLFNISCKKEKESHEGDIEVIINEDIPQNLSPSLKFEEDLSIIEEGLLMGTKKVGVLSPRPERVKVIMAYFSHELFKEYFEQFELNAEYLYSKIV